MNDDKPHTTIMLIDDDADDRKLFEEGLNKIDSTIKLDTAEGGIEAFLKLKEDMQRLPDFIFLDLNMPQMDGHEVLAELKNDELLKNIPVIIYTTSSDPQEKAQTIKRGAVSWITKTNSMEEMKKTISEMLTKYKDLSA
ncbi:MAG: response regulator [Chitinophagales bacterium]